MPDVADTLWVWYITDARTCSEASWHQGCKAQWPDTEETTVAVDSWQASSGAYSSKTLCLRNSTGAWPSWLPLQSFRKPAEMYLQEPQAVR